MKRRQFLAVSALALATPGAVLAREGQVEYSRAAFDALRQSGKPVLLDFYTTCEGPVAHKGAPCVRSSTAIPHIKR